jgi:hypothetical protein
VATDLTWNNTTRSPKSGVFGIAMSSITNTASLPPTSGGTDSIAADIREIPE